MEQLNYQDPHQDSYLQGYCYHYSIVWSWGLEHNQGPAADCEPNYGE